MASTNSGARNRLRDLFTPRSRHGSTYKYARLKKSTNLRLITLYPGKFEDKIIISLSETSFYKSEPPYYEALSYAWGSEANPELISVKKAGSLPVTQNLYIALKHLRRKKEPRTLWIDAVSIDQSNNDEKSQQVAMMGDIFRLAFRVTAWLGPEDRENDSDGAMRLLEYMGSQVSVDYHFQTMNPAVDCVDPTIGHTEIPLPYSSEELAPLYHLISRPWFERLWIRQEIFLANSTALVRSGSQKILWARFRAGLYCLFVKDKYAIFPGLYDRLFYIKGLLAQTKIVSLLNLREIFGQSKCQDDRDRIYAVSAMLDPSTRAYIVPDYSLSTREVYQNAMLGYIDVYGLELLRGCELNLGPAHSSPTWVPDWSQEATTMMHGNPFLACSNLAAWYDTSEAGVLKVVGKTATVIREVQDIGRPANDSSDTQTYRWMRSVLQGKDSTGQYVNGDSMLDAYARTLVYDGIVDEMGHNTNYITLDSARSATKLLFSEIEEVSVDTSAFDRLFLRLLPNLAGKVFIVCEEGYIGIAPPATQLGDLVCVILGCAALMVLRPVKDGFLAVGECFVYGLSKGEALLGPLPDHIRVAQLLQDGTLARGFVDGLQNIVSFVDPRLEALGLDLEDFKQRLEDDPNSTLFVESEELRARGVNIEYFNLL